ncbi:hypothetical protein Tco_0283594, partial [Tanacetum coccineum]
WLDAQKKLANVSPESPVSGSAFLGRSYHGMCYHCSHWLIVGGADILLKVILLPFVFVCCLS